MSIEAMMLWAISEDNLGLMQIAARFRGDDLSSEFRTPEGQNMLMIAVNSASHKCIASLLQNGAKVNINEVDHAGNTALMHAAKNGDAISINLLLPYFADRSLKNSEGLTAYDLAARGESSDSKFRVCMESLDLLALQGRQDVGKSEECFSGQDAGISNEDIAKFFGWLDGSHATTIVPVSADDFPGADLKTLETFFDLS